VPNHAVPLPWLVPKPEPLIVTWVPTSPPVGETPVTIGGAGVKGIVTVTVVLLLIPSSVADIFAVPTPAGTTGI
jgi:hypothetical protein